MWPTFTLLIIFVLVHSLSPKCTLKFPLRIRRSVSQPKLLIVLQLLFASLNISPDQKTPFQLAEKNFKLTFSNIAKCLCERFIVVQKREIAEADSVQSSHSRTI